MLIISDGLTMEDAEWLIEARGRAAGLEIGSKGALATFPGSVHWHWRRAGQRGVLEITLWPEKRQVWLTVHANRRADWTDALEARLRDELAGDFSRADFTRADYNPADLSRDAR